METEIRGLNLPSSNELSSGVASSMPWKPLTGLGKAIGIDYDYRDNKIIFSDINLKKISSFVAKNEATVVDIIKQNSSLSSSRQLIVKPEGVAYDWVMDTIYYTDEILNQVISYKISSEMRYVIGQSQSPRAIVVHPCKGYVFWTDVGQRPMIARRLLIIFYFNII
jgi:low density lipoprotein-related protein 2